MGFVSSRCPTRPCPSAEAGGHAPRTGTALQRGGLRQQEPGRCPSPGVDLREEPNFSPAMKRRSWPMAEVSPQPTSVSGFWFFSR